MTAASIPIPDVPFRYRHWTSPLGPLLLYGTDRALWGIDFPVDGHAQEPVHGWIADRNAFPEVTRQLAEYFSRKRRTFSLPLQLGGTPFQLAVWAVLRRIPYGETRSPSSFPAIASSAPTETSWASAADSRSRERCWNWREPRSPLDRSTAPKLGSCPFFS